MRTKRDSQLLASRTGLIWRRARAGLNALFLLLIVASITAFAVACEDDPSPAPAPAATTAPDPTATPTPEPTPTATEAPEPAALSADERTRAFVAGAIEFYGANGLDATVEFYKSEAGIASGRTLILLDSVDYILLVYRALPPCKASTLARTRPFPASRVWRKLLPRKVSGLRPAA